MRQTTLDMTTQNLFFIDARVQNDQAFVAGLQATDAWVLLNADQNGLDQMVRALSGVKDLASIQIISHGAPASLTLGSTTLNLEALQNYQVQLAALGASLSVQGDIQLYGCDVAQGDMVRKPAQPAVVGVLCGAGLGLLTPISVQCLANVVKKDVGLVFEQAGSGHEGLRGLFFTQMAHHHGAQMPWRFGQRGARFGGLKNHTRLVTHVSR